MRRFLLLAIAIFVLIAVGLPCAALYSVLYTQSGLQFVVGHLPQRFGNVGVRIEGVSGTIAHGARASLVEIDQQRVRLEIRGIQTRIRLEPLLWQTISTPDTKVDSVSVDVKRPPPPQPGFSVHEPQFLPRWLTIDIGHADVGQALVIVPDGTRITGTGISGSALLRHRDIRFYHAQLQMGEVHFAVAGSLHAADPMRMAANGLITWQAPGQPVWQLAATATGDLDRLPMSAWIHAPFRGEISGEMLDLTHHWHWQAEAAVRDFDLRAWHLTGALGAIAGKLALNGDAREFLARGTLDPAGLKAGSFNVQFDGGYSRQVLTATRIDIVHQASGAHTIASGSIGIVPGGPRLDLRGTWRNFRWPLVGRNVPFSSSEGSFELSGLRPYDFHNKGLARVAGLAPVPADVSGKLDADGVDISRAGLDLYRGHADVHGQVTWAPVQRWSVAGH